MTAVTRDEFITRLETSWKRYIPCFQALSPTSQSEFLTRQGYACLGDLLGHIIAWWQDGENNIAVLRGSPTAPLPEYNVDNFNARAVARFAGQPETSMCELFETQRAAMLRLVSNLSDLELAQENINTRLYYEILMHWTEHELDAPTA